MDGRCWGELAEGGGRRLTTTRVPPPSRAYARYAHLLYHREEGGKSKGD